MSVKKSIGRITAYAAAVEGGYTGTYEQFCRDQAKFAENAQQVASDAAEVAENLRESKQVLEDVKKESAGLAGLSAKVEEHTSRLDSAEERITALEERTVTAPYYVDSSMAYSKDVPKDALPFAEVNKIGGMTHKTLNLIPDVYNTATINGVTFTKNADNSITVNGTASYDVTYYLINYNINLAPGQYNISGMPKGIGQNGIFVMTCRTKDGNTLAVETGVGATFSCVETTNIVLFLRVYAGATINNAVVYPMLNSGDTAIPYEPYFDGLRSAPVTEVESVGVNMLDESILTKSTEWQYTTIQAMPNTTYTAMGNPPTNNRVGVFVFNSTGEASGSINLLFQNIARTVVTNADGIIKLQWKTYDENYSPRDFNFQINKGATALPYTPYRSDTLPVPAAVQALDGYGWGINADCYNYVDWEKKQFVKRVGRVDMGSLNWTFNGIDIFYAEIWGKPKGVSNLLCGKYPNANVDFGPMADGTITGNTSLSDIIYVKDTAYTDAATFKAAMSGVMLCYELAEPVITDISNLLTEDGYIPVEPGGTVTMVNEHGYDVPSEITFARLTWQ